MSELNGSSGLGGLSREELRAAVRAVVRDVLPDLSSPTGTVEQVVIRSDADLQVFVQRLLALAEDPKEADALRSSRRRFTLASEDAPAAVQGNVVVRVEHGAVTERRVSEAAAQGARLVVGARAVLTPLARDRARALGVVVEKER